MDKDALTIIMHSKDMEWYRNNTETIDVLLQKFIEWIEHNPNAVELTVEPIPASDLPEVARGIEKSMKDE